MAGDPQIETAFFGDLLRNHRIAANLTQEALAERAGLSARGISDLERGARTHPYRETLSMLVSALGLSGAERATFIQAAKRPGKPSIPTGEGGGPPPLPAPLSRLIGRDRELAALGALLRDDSVRLVTLTGTGGVGKTRLALAAAEEVRDSFAEGAVFVDLAPLRDPNRVPDRMASTLGLNGQKSAPIVEALWRFLEARRMLLLLDNFEHVLAAAPIVSELLQACPGMKGLVTSREPLRLQGEREFAVRTFPLPDPSVETSVDELAASAAVRLFVERATAASSDFALAPEQVTTVAAICRRLDGLPLAVELAAPRVKALPLPALLARLESRLPALASGTRDAPARQRTLRDAIAWSHDLLTPDEQTLFRRLGVFVGGWTLEAADRVSGVGGRVSDSVLDTPPPIPDTLDLLASLIDKSLIQPSGNGSEPRFSMLETIREFAGDQLRSNELELTAINEAHARFYRNLAESAHAGLVGPEQAAWLQRLDAEDANLVAALSWTIEHDDPSAGLVFASALWRYWATRGRLAEGRDWLERVLTRPGAGDADPAARADAHNALGNLLGDIGEYRAARQHYGEALALRRSLGDSEGVAGALNNLGLIAAWIGDYEEAMALHGESLELRRALGDTLGEAQSLSNLGDVMTASGDFDPAEAFHQESLRLRDAAQDAAGGAYAHYNLGELARLRGDDERAAHQLQESFRRFDALGDKLGIAYAQWSLGELASRQGDAQRAAAYLADALQTRQEMGDQRGVIECLEAVGVMALRRRSDLEGVRLLAFAYRQRETISCPVPPSTRFEHDFALARARTQHGDGAVDRLLGEPELRTLEQALTSARDILDEVDAEPGGSQQREGDLPVSRHPRA
jgi:predicted ATPase/transcriptional regulator with XRE-family HTH domain/Tfp pilus assembly protein PilF